MRISSTSDQTPSSVASRPSGMWQAEQVSKDEELQPLVVGLKDKNGGVSDEISKGDSETDIWDESPSRTTANSPGCFERRCRDLEHQVKELEQVIRNLEEQKHACVPSLACTAGNSTHRPKCSESSGEDGASDRYCDEIQGIANDESESTRGTDELQKNCAQLKPETTDLQQRQDELHNLKASLQRSVTDLEQQVQELAERRKILSLRKNSSTQDTCKSPSRHLRYLKPRDISPRIDNQATGHQGVSCKSSGKVFRDCI